MEDPSGSSPGKISILQNTIEQLHVTRLIYEEQAALYGPLNVPPYIKIAIQQITDDLASKQAELQELRSSTQTTSTAVNSELKRFWEPFAREGAELVVSYILPENAPKTRVTVLALEMQAVFNMHRLLLELFADTYPASQIRLEVSGVMRQSEIKGLATVTHPHLIVIGAPGANPLSNYLLAQFKGISAKDNFQAVERGYVFRVEGDYLGSPFIVSDEALKLAGAKQPASMPEVGIYNLRGGKKPGFYPRTFQRYDVPSPSDQDCALIVTGWASLPGENRVRRVVVIAGHSRHSTLSATAFVVTNEAWAQQI
ncbi:MAG: hypothetical protein AB1801_24735, partial [Chloroflexota bacterium]